MLIIIIISNICVPIHTCTSTHILQIRFINTYATVSHVSKYYAFLQCNVPVSPLVDHSNRESKAVPQLSLITISAEGIKSQVHSMVLMM